MYKKEWIVTSPLPLHPAPRNRSSNNCQGPIPASNRYFSSVIMVRYECVFKYLLLLLLFYYYYYYLLIRIFHMVFHWSLSDSKSPHVSRTLLRILVVLNNVVVWTVSTHPPTSKSSSPFSNPLVTVPNAPITIAITVTFMFHSVFQFHSKVKVFILLFTFFQFYSVVSRDTKVDNFPSSLFLLIYDYYYYYYSLEFFTSA